MEELTELRRQIELRRYDEALALIDEMDEMARSDKINKIESYLIVLLAHCIKQCAERATTRSWERSIRHSVEAIVRTNKRRGSEGVYVQESSMRELISEVYASALADAADEAFGGVYTPEHLASLFDEQTVKMTAMLLTQGYKPSTFPHKQ
jgi:Domain of unknown function DUF29